MFYEWLFTILGISPVPPLLLARTLRELRNQVRIQKK